MQHIATDRMTLEILDDGEVLLAIDVKSDESVETSFGHKRTTEVGPRNRNSNRIAAQAVDDRRHETVGPHAGRRTGTGDTSG